ncbi:MAG: hypothetical protein L3J96_07000, partial [Thermoplasmata archaeon]|nr:hypothetical protein [Thermoplasmata archaeon]
IPAPYARYNLTFQEAGLPTGTPWSVSLNGIGYGASGSTLVVGGLYPFSAPSGLGSYSLSVAPVVPLGTPTVEFSPQAYPSTVSTNGATVVDLSFSPLYLVSVAAGVGGSVSMTGPSGPVSTPSFLPNGSVVQFLASNSSGYDFVGWVGSGPSSYTGINLAPTVSLTGSIVETAEFVQHAHPAPLTFTLTLHQTTV